MYKRQAAIRQPLQELPVPVGRVGRHRFWLSSLPLRETSEHVPVSYTHLDVYKRQVTPQEEEKLETIMKLISPILRPKIKKSALGRLVLRSTPSSLIMLHTTREVFFDDLRRRDTEDPRKLQRKTR